MKWLECELVRMVDIECTGDIKTPAIQKLCTMEWFEFNKDFEGSIRNFLYKNHMPEGYYMVVGEDDGGLPEVQAVCNYRDGSFHFYRPGKKWDEKYKNAVEVPKMTLRSYTGVIQKANLDKFVEGKETEKHEV